MISLAPRHEVQRARRTVGVIAAILLLTLIAGGLLIRRDQAQQRRSLAARFDSRQVTATRFIDAYVTELVEDELALAERLFSGPVQVEAFADTANGHGFAASVLLDADGRLLASQPADAAAVGRNMITAQYSHLRAAVAGKPAVSNVVQSAVRQQPVVGFAVPFNTPSGRRVFSGAYAIEDTPLAPFVRNALPFDSAHALLIDGAGVVVASNKPDETGKQLVEMQPGFAAISQNSGFVQQHGQTYYVSQGTVGGTPWRLLFAVDESELFRPLSGSARLFSWLALAALAAAGVVTLVLLYRYRLQRALLLDSELRHRTILDTASDAFIAMDEEGRIRDWNAAATALLGWSCTEALGRPLAELVIPLEHREAHRDGLERFLRTGEPSLPAGVQRVQALRADGDPVDVEFRLSRMQWGTGWHFHAFLRDITETLAQEAQLRDLALTDSLTGLANRRAVLDRLDQALSRADRRRNPVAAIFIDVDHFKAINDRHGHATGDAILVEVAKRLRATYRNEDTVARLGGDEFLVVCEDLTAPDNAKVLVDRTRRALAVPYVVNGDILRVTASVGYGLGDGSSSVEQLLDLADAEMYEAKAAGQAIAATSNRR